MYTKQTWVDLPNKATPISALRLSHMEDGIAAGDITNPDSEGGVALAAAVGAVAATNDTVMAGVLGDTASAAFTSLQASLTPRFARSRTRSIVTDGDSISANVGSIGAQGWQAQGLNGIDGRTTVQNVAVSGKLLTAMATDAPTLVDAKFVAGIENICMIWGGTNDLAGSLSVTANSLYGTLVSYHDARHAAGFKTVAFTILPRADSTAGISTFETRRTDLNTLIRNNWRTFADALVDVANDPVMGAAGTSTNTTYYADGTHPTNAGYARIAQFVREALATLGIAGMHSHAGYVESSSVYVPAEVIMGQGAAPATFAYTSSMVASWTMAEDVTTAVGFSAYIPSDWREFTFEILWANGGAGAGNVYFNSFWKAVTPGVVMPANSTTFQLVAAAAQDTPVLTPWLVGTSPIAAPASRFMSFVVQRVGNHANDTLQNKLGILGMVLRKRS